MKRSRLSLYGAMFGRINEDVAAAKSMAAELESQLTGGESNYDQFVATLKKAMSDQDFVKMLRAGTTEDAVTVGDANPSVSDLTPVQKEIGMANSFGFLLKTPGAADATIKMAKSGAGGPEMKIVTLNSTYIIDGHHRWSQLFMLNPNSTIQSFDIQIPVNDSADGLKIAQLAIAAKVGTVPAASGDTATDIFGALKGPEALRNYLSDPAYKPVLQSIATNGLIDQTTGKPATNEEEAKNLLVNHAGMLVAKGTDTNISRFSMPQFDPKVGGPEFTDVKPELTAGKVNWKNIAAAAGAMKAESIRREDAVVLERWQKLAGIIKG
jgi:hypothetical protein